MSTDSCLHPTFVYRFNVILNTFKKRTLGFPYIEASTEATSQVNHSGSLASNSIFQRVTTTIRKNKVGTVNKKRTDIVMPTCKSTWTNIFNRIGDLKMTVNKDGLLGMVLVYM